mmetsp:Transcript_5995/g.24557  ORF Transcript_5995/g.24557 Transcript_5995/m.24557 type:complete len:278 (+) Transcript_5995:196-1029(+)
MGPHSAPAARTPEDARGLPPATLAFHGCRLASDAQFSTAILPLRRIGACPSTSSPRRTSSTMSSPSPSATTRSSAGAPRCLAPARRVTGSTVPGASSRATAPTPSPPHPGRRSTSATASASAPASGARRAALGRAHRRGRRASSLTRPRQTPGCSSPTEGSNGARRCRRRPRRSAAIDASSAWTRSPSTGSSAASRTATPPRPRRPTPACAARPTPTPWIRTPVSYPGGWSTTPRRRKTRPSLLQSFAWVDPRISTARPCAPSWDPPPRSPRARRTS